MKKRAVVFLFFLFTICKLSYADQPLNWYQGSLVLRDNTVLTGDISMESQHDLVLFRTDGKVNVYPAYKIAAVYYYDPLANVNRRFLTLKTENDQWHPIHLYEVVLKGEISVIRKLKALAVESYCSAYDYDYFLVTNGGVIKLERFRKIVYPEILKEAGVSLSVYVRENKLDPNESAAAIQIVDHYNHMRKSETIMARY